MWLLINSSEKFINNTFPFISVPSTTVPCGIPLSKFSFLGLAINNSFAHFIHDITQEKKEQDRLHQQAHIDALTQVGNRYYFQDEMQKVLDSKTSATLCYCDLDHLKYVNDNYGHDKGDAYICDFVEILKSNIREDDIIARLGGDEFCILFKNGSIDSINSKMELINEEFSKQANEYPQSFSYGTVYINGNEETALLNILQTADQRMYAQKRKK